MVNIFCGNIVFVYARLLLYEYSTILVWAFGTSPYRRDFQTSNQPVVSLTWRGNGSGDNAGSSGSALPRAP